MVLRSTFVGVRAAAFAGAFLVYLLGHAFLPGATLGGDGEALDAAASALYSMAAGLGTFLLVFGAWTYRVQRAVMRLWIVRLLFARAVVGVIVIASGLVVAACLVWVPVARAVLTFGAILSLILLGVSLIAKGPGLRRRTVRAS